MRFPFSIPENFTPSAAMRFCIASAALLFLLFAIGSSLPDSDTVREDLEQHALAGYQQISVTTPSRPPILEEYYDHPVHGTASIRESEASPD